MKSIRAIAVAASLLFCATAYAASPTLQVGASGSGIVALQNQLISKGYLGAGLNTGYFGQQTLAAVKKFQCASNVVCSGSSYGTVGPKTNAALFGSTGSAGAGSSGTGSTSSKPLEFSGWMPYWHPQQAIADVLPHLSQFTTVNPFVYTVTSDGLAIDNGPLDEEPWKSFIAEAKAKHVRVIPTVMWGSGPTEQAILSDSAKRVALEDQIASIVSIYGFDGIDIDFEAKQSQTKDYFSTFLKGLYQRMGNKFVYCSIESRMPLEHRFGINGTPPPDATEYANDYVALNKYCDRVLLMTYDQGYVDVLLNAARAQPYVPVSDPTWVENIVELAAQTISKDKLIIGVPTYGYEYQVTSDGTGYKYQRLWAFNQNYATQLASLLNVVPTRNSADELSIMYKSTPATQALSNQASVPGAVALSNTTPPPTDVHTQSALATSLQTPFNIVWWSDAQAISDKVALARKLGVRGIAVFKLDGSEDQNIWNVLK